jgi:histidinol-phosphatase (PHP family)
MTQMSNKTCGSTSYLIDYHLHTSCSKDGAGEVNEHCRQAVKRNFTEICFTNHQEWISAATGHFDYAMRNNGWQQLLSEIEDARKQFPMLAIRFGCEIGHYPQYVTEIIRFTQQHPFDYIIGSIHSLDGKILVSATSSDDKDEDKKNQTKKMRQYLLAIKEMVDHAYFDCIGHLDYAKKNMPSLALTEYQDLIWDIAKSMKKNNIGFELNTSGWHHLAQECYPSFEILKIMKDAGISIVTVGSDSHSPKALGQDILKGLEMLKRAGFEAVCTFSERIPSFHPLGTI